MGWLRVVKASLVAVFLGHFVSGCYISTERKSYPQDAQIERGLMVRQWTDDQVRLTLRGDGTFEAVALPLDFSDCPEGGFVKKSGEGTWISMEGGEATELSVRFSDGCEGALWGGIDGGDKVLWSYYPDRDQVLILQ